MTTGLPVRLQDVTRRFGRVTALAGVSMAFHPGEVVGLLGPNGAGKTTAMRILAGYLRPDSGSVTIDGRAVGRRTRAGVGYLPEVVAPPAELTPAGYLAFCARVHGLPRGERATAIERTLRSAGLLGVAGRRIGTLSKGNRQRVGLAQALLHEPGVLLLDEPTTGLDPAQAADARALITRLGKRRTVLVSSHLLTEVRAMCTRVVVINEGTVVADAGVDELTRRSGDVRLEVRVEGDADDIASAVTALSSLAGVRSADVTGNLIVVRGRGDDLARRVSAAVVGAGAGLIGMGVEEESLEDAYLRLVK